MHTGIAKEQAWQERRGLQSAKSRVGAIGVMQLMPKTAKELKVDPTNVEQNIKGGMKYLARQLKTFKGNYALALAAYNAGPGNVKKAGNSVPPFKETQKYVKSILRNAARMSAPVLRGPTSTAGRGQARVAAQTRRGSPASRASRPSPRSPSARSSGRSGGGAGRSPGGRGGGGGRGTGGGRGGRRG